MIEPCARHQHAPSHADDRDLSVRRRTISRGSRHTERQRHICHAYRLWFDHNAANFHTCRCAKAASELRRAKLSRALQSRITPSTNTTMYAGPPHPIHRCQEFYAHYTPAFFAAATVARRSNAPGASCATIARTRSRSAGVSTDSFSAE